MEAAPLVIVGSGLAGWTTAREFRKLDRETRVMLITGDSGDFYSKPMLSNAFATGRAPAQLVTTPAAQMARELNVELLSRARVTALDVEKQKVETSAGSYPYSRLVLALGADPIRLPLGGDGAQEVLSVNDLEDYARLRHVLKGARRVLILGAGLIGCEFANDLAGAGFQVTVADPALRPLAALAPEPAGAALAEGLAAGGVRWRLGAAAQTVERAAAGYRVTLSDGAGVDADAVISAVGLRPRITLAREAGLAVNRGIVVDAFLRTSAGNVHALGDCAEIGTRVRPYVLPIMHAARGLARTLAGEPTEVLFPPMPVVVKTPACPLVVHPVEAGESGAWSVVERENGVKMIFSDGASRVRGFALTGPRAAERGAMTRLLAA